LCIPTDYFCDGDDDCRDNSDEKDCQVICEQSSQFFCDLDLCLPLSDHCDGVADCIDESDEANCTSNNTTNGRGNDSSKEGPRRSHKPARQRPCEEHEWRCKDGACIRKDFWCDGHEDCLDGSDEAACGGTVMC
ncbi:hypothetical protein J437_LFUL005232, partial [Ladona fulva]